MDDVESTVKYLDTLITKMRTIRSPPLSEFILSLSNCIDKTGKLEPFDEIWKKMEML
jgi:hypothetical protein